MGFSYDTNNWVGDLDNGYEELEIEVDFDYEPFEPMTRHYPGADEAVIINTVYAVTDTGLTEICVINKDDLDRIENDIINDIEEARAEAEIDSQYGYMLENF